MIKTFRVDHGIHGDENLVGFSVVFQKSPIHLHKHKSPSALRHNQIRSEIRQKQKSQILGLGTQAGPLLSPSQREAKQLISTNPPKDSDVSQSTSSESKVVINSSASSAPSYGPTNSASFCKTPETIDKNSGTTSVTASTNHPNLLNISPHAIITHQQSTHSFPAPPIASTHVSDGTTDRKFYTASNRHPPSSTSTVIDIDMSVDNLTPSVVSGRKRGRSLTPTTPAYDSLSNRLAPGPARSIPKHSSPHQPSLLSHSQLLNLSIHNRGTLISLPQPTQHLSPTDQESPLTRPTSRPNLIPASWLLSTLTPTSIIKTVKVIGTGTKVLKHRHANTSVNTKNEQTQSYPTPSGAV